MVANKVYTKSIFWMNCILFCMWLPEFLIRHVHPPEGVSIHWGSTEPIRIFLSLEQHIKSTSLTLTHCHWCFAVRFFFLSSLNVWQLSLSGKFLLVFPSSNCNPQPLTNTLLQPSLLHHSSHHQWIYSPITVAMECNISCNNKTSSFHNGGTVRSEKNVACQQSASSARCGQLNYS